MLSLSNDCAVTRMLIRRQNKASRNLRFISEMVKRIENADRKDQGSKNKGMRDNLIISPDRIICRYIETLTYDNDFHANS